MSETTTATGQCLCGSVTVTAAVESRFDACHCKMCRTWGGGPYFSIHADTVTFTGDDLIASYTSSEWAERAFCRRCGTHLYFRLKHDSGYSLPLGLLNDDHEARFEEQIFIDRKPAAYSFADDTENLTAAETLAKYTPPAS
ncbi:MAG: GFA family protein [Pseudomonadota bacterium]